MIKISSMQTYPKKLIRIIKNQIHFLSSLVAVAFYFLPRRKLTVIGVTGTDGKTTTSSMIYHILKQAGIKVALISTVGAYLGTTPLDTGFHVTTPNAWQLQKLLARIVKRKFRVVVLEMTSIGLDQHRLLSLLPEIAVLTNITKEHLDYHGTYANYVRAKAKIFKHAQVAIVNSQDESYSSVKPYLHPVKKIIKYPSKLSADLLKTINSRFREDYNRLNAQAAVLTAINFGVKQKVIGSALKSFEGVAGRNQIVAKQEGVTYVVDFAHTPNALQKSLENLRSTVGKGGKLIAVYGSAGLRDPHKRPHMGRIGALYADEVVLTAEDPRTESVWAILDQMSSDLPTRAHVHKIPDRLEAIKFAHSIATQADVVVVCGKGHEQTMCFGTIEHPWSDQEAILKTINKQ